MSRKHRNKRQTPILNREQGIAALAIFGIDQEASERASDSDRAWFAARPGTSIRIRSAFPGEFPGVGSEALVHVMQAQPGVRFRSLLREVR